jgi:WD40-like Beta Propeller Repeat
MNTAELADQLLTVLTAVSQVQPPIPQPSLDRNPSLRHAWFACLETPRLPERRLALRIALDEALARDEELRDWARAVTERSVDTNGAPAPAISTNPPLTATSVRRRRPRAVLVGAAGVAAAALVAAGILGAATGSDTSRTASVSHAKASVARKTSPRGGGFTGHLVIIASCDGSTGSHNAIRLTGYDPVSWDERVSEAFSIPGPAALSESQDDDLCTMYGDDENIWMREPIQARQVFSPDFSRLAVQIYDSGSTHVGYLEATGKLVDLTGHATAAYSSSVHEMTPAFAPDGQSLWYTMAASDNGTSIAYSRDLASGRPQREGSLGGTPVLIGSPSSVISLGHYKTHAVLSPDGTRVAQGNMAYPPEVTGGHSGLTVWQFTKGTARNKDGTGGAGVYTRVTGESAESPVLSSCIPIGWADADTVLCDVKGDFYRVAVPQTPSHGAKFNLTVDSVRPILPSTNRINHAPAVSSDGRQIAFLSGATGGQDQAFTVSTTPGSQPRLLPAAATRALESGNVIAWQ